MFDHRATNDEISKTCDWSQAVTFLTTGVRGIRCAVPSYRQIKKTDNNLRNLNLPSSCRFQKQVTYSWWFSGVPARPRAWWRYFCAVLPQFLPGCPCLMSCSLAALSYPAERSHTVRNLTGWGVLDCALANTPYGGRALRSYKNILFSEPPPLLDPVKDKNQPLSPPPPIRVQGSSVLSKAI